MNKRYSLIILVLTCGICEGQNLVPNPSFEVYDTCPDNTNNMEDAAYWSSYRNSPDYFNTCDSGYSTSVPTNNFGYQWPADGNAYAGLYLYYSGWSADPTYREIIGAKLLTPLEVGVEYYVEFKVIRANGWSGEDASNGAGVRFLNAPYSVDTPIGIDNVSHVFTSEVITDSTRWTTVSGHFVSDSAYQFIAIGNFFDNNHTNTTGTGYSYYYIDDVCVSTDSLTCDSLVSVIYVHTNKEFSLFPNPFCNFISIHSRGINTVILYDVTAKELLRQTFTGTANINTEQLSRGLYFYELRNSKRTISKGKVVKQ